MRSFFPTRRWPQTVLLFQILLVALAAAPAKSQAETAPSRSDVTLQCVRPDAPLFSEVLSASRSAVVTPTSLPAATPLVVSPRVAVAATPSPPTPTPLPAPVRRAVVAAPTLPPPSPATAIPTPEVIPPPAPTPVPPPPPAPVEGCDQIIALVNQVRADNGLPPLTYNSQLEAAAQQYAEFLAANNVLTHNADGRRLDARAESAGYTTWLTLGENLAGGYDKYDDAISAWMASPGHRDNILNSNFTETGVGCAWNASSSYGWFFVQEFGRRSQ